MIKEGGIYTNDTKYGFITFSIVTNITTFGNFGIRIQTSFTTNKEVNMWIKKNIHLFMEQSFWHMTDEETKSNFEGYLGQLDQELLKQLQEKCLKSETYHYWQY